VGWIVRARENLTDSSYSQEGYKEQLSLKNKNNTGLKTLKTFI
jgi:hypothetical protein